MSPVEDLTPLSALQDLEKLYCLGIPLTTSILPLKQCTKLKTLICSRVAKDLDLLRERMPDVYFKVVED